MLDINDRYFCKELLIFSSKLSNQQYSLQNEIFNTKNLNRVIGIVGDVKNPLMYFGGVPQSTLEQYQYHYKCKINKKSPNWECMLNDITLSTV